MILTAWVVALAGTSGLIALLLSTPETFELPQLSDDASIVVIGSSLLGAAIPARSPEEGILKDGRNHVRWLLGAIGESVSLDLLESAIDQGAETVLLEFSTFTTRRLSQPVEDGHGLVPAVERALSSFTARLQGGYDTLRGRDLFASAYHDNAAPAQNWRPERAGLEKTYALRFTEPSDRLGSLLRKAASLGTEVILIEPPRPVSGMRHVPGGKSEFVRHLTKEAQLLERSLWLIGPDWPDALFRDASHLGLEGRQRFLSELQKLAEVDR